MPKVFIKSRLKRKKLRMKAEPNGHRVQPKYHIYEYFKPFKDKHAYIYAGSTGFREVKKCSQLSIMDL